MPRKHLLLLSFLSVILSWCSSSFILDTEIPATDENKAIWEVVDTYRKGLEARDLDIITPIISKKYYENGSTTQTKEDDYGYPELIGVILPKLLNNVKAVQYRIKLMNIRIIGKRAKVTYEYWGYFLYSHGEKEGWHNKNDFNEIELVKEKDGWKIIGGL